MWVQHVQNVLYYLLNIVSGRVRTQIRLAVSSSLVSSLLPNQVTKWGQKSKQINMFVDMRLLQSLQIHQAGSPHHDCYSLRGKKRKQFSIIAANHILRRQLDKSALVSKFSIDQGMKKQKGPFLFFLVGSARPATTGNKKLCCGIVGPPLTCDECCAFSILRSGTPHEASPVWLACGTVNREGKSLIKIKYI